MPASTPFLVRKGVDAVYELAIINACSFLQVAATILFTGFIVAQIV